MIACGESFQMEWNTLVQLVNRLVQLVNFHWINDYCSSGEKAPLSQSRTWLVGSPYKILLQEKLQTLQNGVGTSSSCFSVAKHLSFPFETDVLLTDSSPFGLYMPHTETFGLYTPHGSQIVSAWQVLSFQTLYFRTSAMNVDIWEFMTIF